ncbi:hypothetical protein M0R45_000799 [Rubus argutus]|uniref:Terpene synthase N-terminal domain-containing protein n=1 Tax=Rubus argutus TaxID=59490 RepID=A0AAW1VNB2_RUBAR
MDDIFVQHSQKLESFTNVLRDLAESEALEGLNMIDAVQRLGIDYHFQQVIDEILHKQMNMMISAHGDLHEVAIRFRLLRQQGYFVPAGKYNFWGTTKLNFGSLVIVFHLFIRC